jgi:DNA-binding response OmpR family regulator
MPAPPYVLIVDDDASIRTLLSRVVQLEGFTPVAAPSGTDGQRHLAELGNETTLVLLDMTLPDMDGFRFRQLQAEAPGASDIPTIILSGRQLTAPEVDVLQPAAVLLKPVSLPNLRRYIVTHAARVE